VPDHHFGGAHCVISDLIYGCRSVSGRLGKHEHKGRLMKWTIFAIGLIGMVPLIQVLRRKPLEQPWIWILLGFFPVLLSVVPYLNLSAIAWPIWPGNVKGFQITALDLYALAVYVALPRGRQPIPFRLSMIFYFSAVLLSIFFAQVSFAAVFYAWQLARMFLIYAVVIKSGADERIVGWLMKGMAAGLVLEAFMTIWERFVQGIIQTGGSFGHQNYLGMTSYFVIFPFFALLMAGQRGWLTAITPLAGTIIWVLTASRATLGLGGFGLIALFIVSALRKWTARKARVLLFGAVILAILIPVGLSSLETRFAANPLADDYDERAVLIDVAAKILSDHPMGIGANNFTLVANTGGYYARAPLSWMSSGAIVHNIYWLTAAETGYLGIIALVILLLHPLVVALHCGWRHRKDQRGDLLLGIGMALLIVYIHSYFEWIFLTMDIQYLFAIMVGLVGGLATQLGYWRRPYIQDDQFGANRSALRKVVVGEPVL
jgi:O-antigen ligase